MSDKSARAILQRVAQRAPLGAITDAFVPRAFTSRNSVQSEQLARRMLEMRHISIRENAPDPSALVVSINGREKSRVVRDHLIRAGHQEAQPCSAVSLRDRADDLNQEKAP